MAGPAGPVVVITGGSIMWVLMARRRRSWLVVALPVAGWLLLRLVRSGKVPAATPVVGSGAGRRARGAAPRPAGAAHRPVTSPHARDIAAHNRRVIEDYRGRHAAGGGTGF